MPVTLAVALTALEGLTFLVYGLVLLPDLFGGRAEAGSTALFFFVLYGVFLGACACQLLRLRAWPRAPVVLAQLIELFLGYGFWDAGATLVAVALVGSAVAVLAALFHPRSLAALGTVTGTGTGT